jgi:hypothetical protein
MNRDDDQRSFETNVKPEKKVANILTLTYKKYNASPKYC